VTGVATGAATVAEQPRARQAWHSGRNAVTGTASATVTVTLIVTVSMTVVVAVVAVETITALRPLVGRIAQHGRSLAKQLEAAASSVALNIGEAQYSDPGNRRARFHGVAGSAGETCVSLQRARGSRLAASLRARPGPAPTRARARVVCRSVQVPPPPGSRTLAEGTRSVRDRGIERAGSRRMC
jgi:hypothetical protein